MCQMSIVILMRDIIWGKLIGSCSPGDGTLFCIIDEDKADMCIWIHRAVSNLFISAWFGTKCSCNVSKITEINLGVWRVRAMTLWCGTVMKISQDRFNFKRTRDVFLKYWWLNYCCYTYTESMPLESNETSCEVSLSNGCIVRFTWSAGTVVVQRNPSKYHYHTVTQ